jgi:hypothetical protein
MDTYKPKVILLQEITCEDGKIVGDLEILLGGWEFSLLMLGVDIGIWFLVI